MAGEGPLFHPYFTDSPIRNNADVSQCDWQISERMHDLLFENGVYKPSVKAYLSTTHFEEHVDEFTSILVWILKNLSKYN